MDPREQRLPFKKTYVKALVCMVAAGLVVLIVVFEGTVMPAFHTVLVYRVLRVLSHSFYSATPPCVQSNNRVSVQFVPKRTRLSSSDKRGDTIISHFPIVLFQNDDSTNPATKTAYEPRSWPVL
jgi:hypothetical protein